MIVVEEDLWVVVASNQPFDQSVVRVIVDLAARTDQKPFAPEHVQQ